MEKLTQYNVLKLIGEEIFWCTSIKPRSYNIQTIKEYKNSLIDNKPLKAIGVNYSLTNADLTNAYLVNTEFSLTNNPNDIIYYVKKKDFNNLIEFGNLVTRFDELLDKEIDK